MWEGLTVALSCTGFLAAVILMIAELPAVIDQSLSRYRQHHHGHL